MAFGASDSQLNIVIDAQDRTKAAIESVQSNLDKVQGKLKALKPTFQKMALIGSAAFAAIGVAVGTSIKQFSDFEKSMSNVATLVDTNTESIKEMGKEVIEMSKRVPVGIDELTSALYQVRSAGISAADAMSVLEASGKLAVAGLGTTTEATDLLTSAFNVFAKQGYSSDEVANILFKTVKAGKTTVAELAQSFGMVAPIAGELNIDLMELQAATAALTTTGMKASVTQSQLRVAMIALIKPTTDMNDIFAELGVKSGRELIETSGGLVEAFKRVREITGESDEQLAKAFGSAEALNAVLSLTSGTVGESFITTFDEMKGSTDLLTEAFDKQSKTVSAQMQILKNRVNAVTITIGESFAPILTKLIDKLTPLIEKITTWIEKNPQLTMVLIAIVAALSGLVAIIGILGLALPGIIVLFGALHLSMLPIIAVILAIIVVVGLLIAIGWSLYKNWDEIKTGFIIIFENWKAKVISVLESIKKAFLDAVNWVKEKTIDPLIGWINSILLPLQRVWDMIIKVTGKIGSVIGGTVGKIGGVLGFQQGGIVPGQIGAPVPAIVHAGETIIPVGKHMGGGINITITGNTFMSDDEAAEKIGDRIVRILKMQNRFAY